MQPLRIRFWMTLAVGCIFVRLIRNEKELLYLVQTKQCTQQVKKILRFHPVCLFCCADLPIYELWTFFLWFIYIRWLGCNCVVLQTDCQHVVHGCLQFGLVCGTGSGRWPLFQGYFWLVDCAYFLVQRNSCMVWRMCVCLPNIVCYPSPPSPKPPWHAAALGMG